MSRPARPRLTVNPERFMELVRTIVAGETSRAARMIAESPELAHERAVVGATREDAARYFFEEIGRYLIAGDTALHIAAAGFKWRIVRSLVASGADSFARNRHGAEPLHSASAANTWNPTAQAATIDRLIQAGANPNAIDKRGVAPLHGAVRTRCAAAVQALLAGGAAPRFRNGSGSTPLHLAVQNTGRGGSGSPRAIEQQRRIVLLLLQSGAKLEDRDGRGRTVREAASDPSVIGVGRHGGTDAGRRTR